MSLTSLEVSNLIWSSFPLRQKIGPKIYEYRKEKGIRDDCCAFCGKKNKYLAGYFCGDPVVEDDWVDCAEEFYKENLHLLLEWITE